MRWTLRAEALRLPPEFFRNASGGTPSGIATGVAAGHLGTNNLIHTVIQPPAQSKSKSFSTPSRFGQSLRSLVVISLTGLFAVNCVSTSVAALLPVELRKSGNPDPVPIRAELADAVKLLMSATPADQTKGREMIIGEVGPAGTDASPSAGFLFAYAGALNDALKPIFAAPEMRSRLNAAIAACRVAERAGVSANVLMPSVMAFMNDQSEAVALWGVKAAKPVLAVLAVQGPIGVPAVLTAIDATGAKFPATAAASYYAMTIQLADPKTQVVDPKAMTMVIDAVQKLLESRTALWSTQIATEPLAENLAFSMLCDPRVWKAHSTSQKNKTLADLKNLSSLVAQQVVGTVANDQKEAIAALIRQIASSIGAIGVIDGNAELTKTMESVAKSLSPRSTPQQIADACKAIDDTLVKEYPALASDGKMAPTTKATSLSTSK